MIWKKLAVEQKPTIPTHRTNTYASETPVTDGKHVYAYFGMTGLFCFDMQGELAWKKDLGTHRMTMDWGTGSSPVLEGDLLFIQCDNEQDSFLVALNKLTGDEVWRDMRDQKSSWCSPYVWKNEKRTELVTAGTTGARAYDPATGKVLWALTGMNGRCSATPVGDKERCYFGCGGGMGGSGPLVAIRAGAEGTFSVKEAKPDQVAWSVSKGGPPMASPLLYQGRLYILEQRGGLMSCFDAVDGKEIYKKRIPGAKGFTSSPWGYDNKVFCLDESGETFVIEAGPEFKVLGQNALSGAMCWSSPAIAGGALFLRDLDSLYCIKP